MCERVYLLFTVDKVWLLEITVIWWIFKILINFTTTTVRVYSSQRNNNNIYITHLFTIRAEIMYSVVRFLLMERKIKSGRMSVNF